ncbi:MAG: nucleoside hydrolase, partial [Chloroflexota bacterium]
ITTVAGNAELAQTTQNALAILELAGHTDIPLAAGADRPLRRELVTAAYVHGSAGLEGADLPSPSTEPRPGGAQRLLVELIEMSERPVTLVPTGPLTNIARLLSDRPELHHRIGAVCLMGGAKGEGNRTASAEFNIWVDPEAARIVFESGLPLTMIDIDTTHQAVVSLTHSDSWAAIGNRSGRIFADLFRYFARFHEERYGWDGSPIHDAMAVAHLVLPGLVETRDYRVDIETDNELTRGRTVVDREGLSGQQPNAAVSLSVQKERFIALVDEVLAAFP